MATIKFHDGKAKTARGKYMGYKTKASMRRLIAYVTRKEATRPDLIRAIGCSPQNAYQEMMLMKEIYGKDKETGRRVFVKHFTMSFKGYEATPEMAIEAAERLLQHKFFNGFQVLYAVHMDTKNIHTHFVINTVNAEDGHVWQLSRNQLQELKDYSDSIVEEMGLSVVDKNAVKKEWKSRGQLEVEKKGMSWKLETKLAVDCALGVAVSREDFIKRMRQLGYEVVWKDTKKDVVFIDKEGHRVRNRRFFPIEKYTKEGMEEQFWFNKDIAEHQEDMELDAVNLFCAGENLFKAAMRLGNSERYPMQTMERQGDNIQALHDYSKENEKGKGYEWNQER